MGTNKTWSTTPPVRVLVVIRLEVIRRAISVLLEQAPSLKLVGEADTTESALHVAAETQPQVILSGIAYPELDPTLLADRLVAECNLHIPVVVLSRQQDSEVVRRGLRSQLAGYLDPDISPAILVAALHVVTAGITILGPTSRRALTAAVASQPRVNPHFRALEALTLREQEVLRLMVEGLMNKEIARRLGVTPRTVEMHVGNIISKIGAHSRTDAVVKAVHLGQVAPELSPSPALPVP